MPFAHWPTYEARVVTAAHRIQGTMRLPPMGTTADYLNLENKSFFPLEKASIYPAGFRPVSGEPLLKAEFLGVSKANLLWVVGGVPSRMQASPQVVTKRRAAVFFADHVLVGEIEMLKTFDLPAFFSKAKPFVTLFQSELYALDAFGHKEPPEERFDFVTVHLGGIEGVVELSAVDLHPRWGGLY